MNWTHFAMALAVSEAAISLSDWIFFGVIFHAKYMTTPEVWRGGSEAKKIAWSLAVALIGTAGFLFLCVRAGAGGYAGALWLALLVWGAASLPYSVTNVLFVKYDPSLALSHSLGWLARLVIAALAYGWLLG